MTISKLRYVILNSTILFCVAHVLEMTLHEFGHFFASIMVHAKGISMHHNYVSNIDAGLPLKSIIFIKAAGPLVSLVIGMVFHIICFNQKKRNLTFLFNLFMAVTGYIGIFGYLMISPFFTDGDTGYICSALKFPLWLTISVAIAGALTLYFLIRNLMIFFVEMGTKEIVDRKETRTTFIHALLSVPVILGIAVTTLLNLPVISILSLIAPVFSPFTFFWDYGNALYKKYNLKITNDQFHKLNSFNPLLIILLIFTIIYNRLLVKGIYFN
jgi:hypothetical protein